MKQIILTIMLFIVAITSSADEMAGSAKFDTNKYIACSTWALSAIVIIQDTQQHKRSIEQSVLAIYKEPQPYLAELANLGLSASPDGKLKNTVDARRRTEFLTGVCYASDKAKQLKRNRK